MYRGTIISLCDLTGIMVKPWVESGYRAVLVDPQHKEQSIQGGWSDYRSPYWMQCLAFLKSLKMKMWFLFLGFHPVLMLRYLGRLILKVSVRETLIFKQKQRWLRSNAG